MDAIEWLERNAFGFSALSTEERIAPMHFSLLWSYFEAEALGNRASNQAIEYWLRHQSARGKLNSSAFNAQLNHFKSRYFSNGQLTSSFHSLGFQQNKWRTLVENVISGQNNNSIDGVIALFVLIYRLRNNFFHGPKWSDHLQDQLQNFTAANDAIMTVIDMSRS